MALATQARQTPASLPRIQRPGPRGRQAGRHAAPPARRQDSRAGHPPGTASPPPPPAGRHRHTAGPRPGRTCGAAPGRRASPWPPPPPHQTRAGRTCQTAGGGREGRAKTARSVRTAGTVLILFAAQPGSRARAPGRPVLTAPRVFPAARGEHRPPPDCPHLFLGQAPQAVEHVGRVVAVVLLLAAVLLHVVAAGPRQRHVLVHVGGAVQQEGGQLAVAPLAHAVACGGRGRGAGKLGSGAGRGAGPAVRAGTAPRAPPHRRGGSADGGPGSNKRTAGAAAHAPPAASRLGARPCLVGTRCASSKFLSTDSAAPANWVCAHPSPALHCSSPTVSPVASASSCSDRQPASRPSPGSTLAQNLSMSCSQAPAPGRGHSGVRCSNGVRRAGACASGW